MDSNHTDHACSPNRTGISTHRFYANGFWSARQDLNLRPPAPKAGALPGCATRRSYTLFNFQLAATMAGLSHRPVTMRALVLYRQSFDPFAQRRIATDWTMPDLNRRPSACKADALPTELIAPFAFFLFSHFRRFAFQLHTPLFLFTHLCRCIAIETEIPHFTVVKNTFLQNAHTFLEWVLCVIAIHDARHNFFGACNFPN